jgi:excisionase family DNA binding protein
MQPTQTTAALVEGVLALARQQALAEFKQQPPKPTSLKRLLTAREAGEYLGRTEAAVRQLIHKRLLPVIKFGRSIRIDVHDLERIVDDCRR